MSSTLGTVIDLVQAGLQLVGSAIEHSFSKKESKENPETKEEKGN